MAVIGKDNAEARRTLRFAEKRRRGFHHRVYRGREKDEERTARNRCPS